MVHEWVKHRAFSWEIKVFILLETYCYVVELLFSVSCFSFSFLLQFGKV